MAHFAELDKNNRVKRVIVVSSKNFLNDNGVEDESLGIAYCKSLYGSDTEWRQTSINNRIRRRFATVGCIYDEELDVFYDSTPPFDSWTLHPTRKFWEAPIPMPAIPDGKVGYYVWDEKVYENDNTTGWVFVDETPTEPAE